MKTMTDIARAHRADVDQARALVRQAIDQAAERWIPVAAVGDALVEELAALGGSADGNRQLAAHLRRIAAFIEPTRPTLHS